MKFSGRREHVIDVVQQQPSFAEHRYLVSGMRPAQLGPAAEAPTFMALMGDEDRLGGLINSRL